MCQFFSFCTEPEEHGGRRFYFDWNYRKENLQYENDSHSIICKHFGLNEDKCNKYEYNPLKKIFTVDQINSPVDDRVQAEDWVKSLDFKQIVEPLVIKPIVNPFELPPAELTDRDVGLLKKWASVRDSVWASVRASVRDLVWDLVWDSVRDSVRASVRDLVGDSVWDSVRDLVWDSVRDSVRAYISSFFAIEYKYDYSPCVRLWERGIVPSFDGTTWRLHTGKDAHVIYEWKKE